MVRLPVPAGMMPPAEVPAGGGQRRHVDGPFGMIVTGRRLTLILIMMAVVMPAALITFPHGMKPALRKELHGSSFDEFAGRLSQTNTAVTKGDRR